MKGFIVEYNTTTKKIKSTKELIDQSTADSLWDNADLRQHFKGGPVVGIAFWETDTLWIFANAENEEMAEKVALDMVRLKYGK